MTTVDERLKAVFADAFETTPSQIDDSLSVKTSKEWDSMRSIVLAQGLEDEFQIEFSDDELMSMDSVAKVRSALAQRGIV